MLVLYKANGFEVGVGPSVVTVDRGMAKTKTTTTTLKDEIHAFVFGQKGLMAGLGIQGNRITKITPQVADACQRGCALVESARRFSRRLRRRRPDQLHRRGSPTKCGA